MRPWSRSASGTRSRTAPDPGDDPDRLAHSQIVENGAGQWVSHASSIGQRAYAYDRLGRLASVTDQVGTTPCVTRTYTYNDRAGRTGRGQAIADPSDPCIAAAEVATTPGAAATGYTYDTADRLVATTGTGGSTAWAYDAFGRITTAPVQSDPAGTSTVANTYHVNDLLAGQEIPGVQQMEWSLDPLHRFDQTIIRDWSPATSSWEESATKRNHYDGDDDSPAWVSEDATLPDNITRYIDGIDGGMVMQTGKTGGRQLQL